jgi:hypothetical protein
METRDILLKKMAKKSSDWIKTGNKSPQKRRTIDQPFLKNSHIKKMPIFYLP